MAAERLPWFDDRTPPFRMGSQGHLSWRPLLERRKTISYLHIFACIAAAAAAAVAPPSTAVVDGDAMAFDGRRRRS